MYATVLERWNPRVKRRIDAWGVGDLLVLDERPGSILVQATSGANHASRVQKVRDIIDGLTPEGISETELARQLNNANALRRWLHNKNRIEVWSWSKKGPKGKVKRWEVRREDIKASP